MASVPNLGEEQQKPTIMTTTNALERSDSTASTRSPPGAWVPGDDDTQHNDESPIAGIGEAVVGALGVAGSTAAKYLPASVVSTFSAYAPGMASTSNPDVASGDAKPVDGVDKKQPLTMEPAMSSTVPAHGLTEHPLREPQSEDFDTPEISLNKDSGSEVPSRRSTQEDLALPAPELTTAAQFASPSVMTPLSPASASTATTGAALSTIAVTGHDSVRSGVEPPPPSAADSAWASPSSAEGPLASRLPIGAPAPPTAASSLSSKDPRANGVASSVVSVKSGLVGAGPSAPLDKSLPPTPAMADGVTPGQSELEKDDLSYLAPAIRPQSSTAAVPTEKPVRPLDAGSDKGTSRFTEGGSAEPTPASEMSGSSHSRESSVSTGGTRRVSIVKRIKGEAKIIAGKLKKDDAKVQEGRALLGEA